MKLSPAEGREQLVDERPLGVRAESLVPDCAVPDQDVEEEKSGGQ